LTLTSADSWSSAAATGSRLSPLGTIASCCFSSLTASATGCLHRGRASEASARARARRRGAAGARRSLRRVAALDGLDDGGEVCALRQRAREGVGQ
jgi:hypothetical protein